MYIVIFLETFDDIFEKFNFNIYLSRICNSRVFQIVIIVAQPRA